MEEKEKKKKRRNLILTIIQLILLLIILYSLYNIGIYFYQNYKNTKRLAEVSEIVSKVEKDTEKQLGLNLDNLKLNKEQLDKIAKNTIDRLKTENSDIVSFIKVDEFKLNNPVTYVKEDNDYYLYRDLQEAYSRPGTLFVNGWNNPDFSDMNTTIFGHNLRTHPHFYAPMFKLLLNLENKDFVDAKKEHIVEIYTKEGYKKYKIFSAYYSNEYDNYIKPNRDKSEWVDYLNSIMKKSINDFKTDIKFKESDKILTLSTCDNVTDEGRFVVHAILL